MRTRLVRTLMFACAIAASCFAAPAPAPGASSPTWSASASDAGETSSVERAQAAVRAALNRHTAAIDDRPLMAPTLHWPREPALPATYSAWWIDVRHDAVVGRVDVVADVAQVHLLRLSTCAGVSAQITSVAIHQPASPWLRAAQDIAALTQAIELPRTAVSGTQATGEPWQRTGFFGPSGALDIADLHACSFSKTLRGTAFEDRIVADWPSLRAHAALVQWSLSARELDDPLRLAVDCPDADAWCGWVRARIRTWITAPDQPLVFCTLLRVLAVLGTAEDASLIQAAIAAVPRDLPAKERNDLIDLVEGAREIFAARTGMSATGPDLSARARAEAAIAEVLGDLDAPSLHWPPSESAAPATFSAWWLDRQHAHNFVGRVEVADGQAQIHLLRFASHPDRPSRPLSAKTHQPATPWIHAWESISELVGATEGPAAQGAPGSLRGRFRWEISHSASVHLVIAHLHAGTLTGALQVTRDRGKDFVAWPSLREGAILHLWLPRTRALMTSLQRASSGPDAADWCAFAYAQLHAWNAAPQQQLVPLAFLRLLAELGTANDLPRLQGFLDALPLHMSLNDRNDLIEAAERTRREIARRLSAAAGPASADAASASSATSASSP